MRALVLGGTGQTGSGVVRGLRARGATVRAATRRPGEPGQILFDWADPATHEAALQDVDAVYLVAPAFVTDPADMMLALIDRALRRGVRRFALLSSSLIDEGPTGLGAVHAGLRARAPGWTVLRPSWFMQNFVDARHPLARGLVERDTLVTATGRGRVGFIDVEDIAAVAVASLYEPVQAAPVLTGPEALSYDEVAAIFSQVAGRTIRHVAASPAEARARLVAAGMPESYATMLVALDERIAAGAEDRTTDEVRRIAGRPPRSLRDFAREVFTAARP